MIYANVDPTINPLNEWLKNYGIWISVAVASVAFLTILVLFIIAKIKTSKIDTQPIQTVVSNNKHLIGGEENIVSKSINGSRISLVLNDYSLLKDDELKDIGVDTIIKMSNKVTLVSKERASEIYKTL